MISKTKTCYLCSVEKDIDQFNSRRKECRSCSKGIKLMYNFGITKEQYDKMLLAQAGTCAICNYEPEPDEMLAVDHDHKCCPGRRSCGKCLRELLCSNCNTGIGLLADSVEVLISAAEYLLKFERSKSF